MSLSLSLSSSRPPLLAHNSWPDFSPLPAVVGLSLMTIHRKGTRLVKIKIRLEAVVNRTHTAGGHTAAPFNSSTRKNRLLPVAYACPLSPIFFTAWIREIRERIVDRFFAKFGSLRFLPRLESIAISRTRIWMQLGVYVVARREKVGGGGRTR